MKTIITEFTLKVWNTMKDWDDGNAESRPFTKNDRNSPLVIAGLHGQIMSGTIWAFEIYDTETGETVIHSEE
jgi:hypothetical protein